MGLKLEPKKPRWIHIIGGAEKPAAN